MKCSCGGEMRIVPLHDVIGLSRLHQCVKCLVCEPMYPDDVKTYGRIEWADKKASEPCCERPVVKFALHGNYLEDDAVRE